MRQDRPLWTCPKCGARLVGRNMSHACGSYSIGTFLAGKSVQARGLFERFAELVGSCGPVTPAPAKTRIAFMVRTRFCAVERLSSRSMRIQFGLPYRLDSPRVQRVDDYNGWFVHWLTIRDAAELDQELRGWLCTAYHQMGEQQRFNLPPSTSGRGLG